MAAETNNTQWWKAEGDQAAARARAMIIAINQANVGFHQDNLRHTRMYENRDYFGTAVSSYMVRTYTQARRTRIANRNTRMSLNITKAAIDTLVSKLGKQKVKPVYLTTGGAIERREKCEKLNKWLYGMFHEAGIYDTYRSVLRQILIYGKGGWKVYRTMKNGKPCVAAEPVFTPEILVDPYDAYYGNPMNLYQQKFIPKDTLRGDPILGKNAQAINNAMSLSEIAGASATETTVVWEAWRKKTDSENGKHIIFTSAGLLYQDEYDCREFPMVLGDYTSPVTGYFGAGVAEELIPIQVELNRIANHIRDSMILCANPRTYVPIGANIDKNHLTNKIGGIVPFAGSTPPIQMVPPAVSRDSFEQQENLYRKGFETVGINLMSASGRNTLGASASGEAIRSYNDIETERFAETQLNVEDLFVRLAWAFHREARAIVKEYGSYVINTISADEGIGQIDFADIDIPDDSFSIQRFPQSALPQEPGFRLATIKEWKDEGYIEPDDARELADFPDIKSKTKYLLSPRKVIEKFLETMAFQPTPKNDKWISYTPEPMMDLAYGLKLGAQMYNYLLLEMPEKTDEEKRDKGRRLELIRGWIQKINNLGKSQPAELPSAPVVPEGQGMQGAQGMPPQALSPELVMGPQPPQ